MTAAMSFDSPQAAGPEFDLGVGLLGRQQRDHAFAHRLDLADELVVDGVVLRHECRADEHRPEISGHFHPKLRLATRGRNVARACFAGDDRRLILPAFGSLTGGLDVGDPAIARNFPGDYCAMLVAQGRLLSFPCRRETGYDATENGAASG